MVQLIVEIGRERKTYLLTAGVTTIGRARSSSICLSNPAVSRNHLRVYFDGRRYFAQDLNSKTGVVWNGQRLSQTQQLTAGDILQVGDFRLLFSSDEIEEAPPLAPQQMASREALLRTLESSRTSVSWVFSWIQGATLAAVFLGGTYIFRMSFLWVLDRFVL